MSQQARSLSTALFFLAGILGLILVVLWSTVNVEEPLAGENLAPPHYEDAIDPESDNKNKNHDDNLRPSGSRPRTQPVLTPSPTLSPTSSSPTRSPTDAPTSVPSASSYTASPTLPPTQIAPSEKVDDSSTNPQDSSPDSNSSSSSSDSNKTAVSSNDDLSTDFRYCRRSKLVPTDPIQAVLPNHEMNVWYQCTGKDYSKFARNLTALVQDQIESGQRPPTWGRRPTPLPDGKSLLVLGNSHLRQTAIAWICQYADQLVDVMHYGDDMDPFMVTRAQFQNQATFWLVVNSWVPYTVDWAQNLARQMQFADTADLVSEIDGVTLGLFNKCRNTSTSNFAIHMEILKANRTDMTCEIPSITSIASVFEKQPILYVPMYSLSRSTIAAKTIAELEKLNEKKKNTGAVLDPRRYIELMGNECGSNSRTNVTKCRNNARAKENMHRCMGPKGGHPDLIAWDAAEYFFTRLAS